MHNYVFSTRRNSQPKEFDTCPTCHLYKTVTFKDC